MHQSPPETWQNNDFFNGLKKTVDRYIAENHIVRRKTWYSVINASLLVSLWMGTYAAFLVWGPRHFAIATGLTVAWALVMLVIQLSVMHDGSHGSSSEYRPLNLLFAFPTMFVGVSSFLWMKQHCQAHHGATNVYGLDLDGDTNGMMRYHQGYPLLRHHKYQYLYTWLLYPLFVVSWVWGSDFKDLKRNTFRLNPKEYRFVLMEVILAKIWHVFLFIALPVYFFESIATVVFCYFLGFGVLGICLAVVFQLAHVTGVQRMPLNRDELGKDWAVRQLLTTANFATRNRFLTWAVGGLNFQIEHHIFPMLSHANYPKIAPVVREYCELNGVPYFEEPTVWSALKKHQRHLKRLGVAPALKLASTRQ